MSERWQSLRVWILYGLAALCGGATIVAVLSAQAGDLRQARFASAAALVCVALLTLFVLPTLLRTARVVSQSWDAPWRVTGGGLIAIGLLGLVVFAAWNTGNNLLFLIFSVLASTLFVAWLAGRLNLSDITVSARFPDHIFAGEPAPLTVTLSNTKRLLPSFSVKVGAYSSLTEHGAPGEGGQSSGAHPAKIPLGYFVYIPHRARAEQSAEVVFARRGHAVITGFDLSTRFPFNFFLLRRRLSARDVDLIVYPRLEPASDELHLLPITAGRTISARRGAGHDLRSLRDYQPQDDLRHIHWKATARTGRLVVREFAAEDERRIEIALDTRAAEGLAAEEQTRRFERGVTLAASLVAHFIDERAEACLTLGDETGRYGVGREHLYECLRRLALVEINPGLISDQAREQFWERLAASTPTAGDSTYIILLTAAQPGSIPERIWRRAHVIFL